MARSSGVARERQASTPPTTSNEQHEGTNGDPPRQKITLPRILDTSTRPKS